MPLRKALEVRTPIENPEMGGDMADAHIGINGHAFSVVTETHVISYFTEFKESESKPPRGTKFVEITVP